MHTWEPQDSTVGLTQGVQAAYLEQGRWGWAPRLLSPYRLNLNGFIQHRLNVSLLNCLT